jgi:hypothetical protein
MIRFLPPDEQEIRQSIADELLKRASQACYWKEDYARKSDQAELPHLQDAYAEEAERYQQFEAIWNEAVDIALGKRKG